MSQSTELALRDPAFLRSVGISGRTAELLYLSKEKPSDFCSSFGLGITINITGNEVSSRPKQAADPSTIFASLPVRQPRNVLTVSNPPYYPTYAGLSPEQRWIYLSWLRDIRQPVYIGYVFLYYYGLERQLLYGMYDLAFEELLELRRCHTHSSFQSYSRCALVCASLIAERGDNLRCLYAGIAEPEYIDNYDLLVAHQAGMGLSVSGILQVVRRIGTLTKHYLTKQPKLIQEMLSAVLFESFQSTAFPFNSLYNISDLPKRSSIIFANISFPPEVRSQELPDFFACEAFINDISAIYLQAHERTKELLTIRRNKKGVRLGKK